MKTVSSFRSFSPTPFFLPSPLPQLTLSSIDNLNLLRLSPTDFSYPSFTSTLTPQAHLPHLFSLFPTNCLLTSSSPPVPPLSLNSGPTPGKPNPHIFLSAARALGIPVGVDEEPANEEERKWRSRGLVFEDAKLGVEAGVRAGMNGEFVVAFYIFLGFRCVDVGGGVSLEEGRKRGSTRFEPRSRTNERSLLYCSCFRFVSDLGARSRVEGSPPELDSRSQGGALESR